MKTGVKNALFTGLGLLIGTVGVKAATSKTARKGYVHAMAQGYKAKADYENLVEQAKAEYDDMKAEASYIADAEKDDEKSETPKKK